MKINYFLKLNLKTKIFAISVIVFTLSIIAYYLTFVYLEKSTSNFCQNHYCLTILPTEGYLALTLGMISLGAVVISLDSWKHQQRYMNNVKSIDGVINSYKNSVTLSKKLLQEISNIIHRSAKNEIDISFFNNTFNPLENEIKNIILISTNNINYTKSEKEIIEEAIYLLKSISKNITSNINIYYNTPKSNASNENYMDLENNIIQLDLVITTKIIPILNIKTSI